MKNSLLRILGLVLLFAETKVYGICMEWNVRNENGKVECKICIECGAGEETSPPCHTAEIFDASSFSGGCIPCKDKHYKAIQNGKNNTLNCKPCAKESCGNRTVLAECSKTSPLICSKCNKGYFENSAGTCREISSSSTPAKTRGTPTTWRAFTTTVKTPKVDTDSNKKDNDQRKDDKKDSNGSKSSFGVVLGVVLGVGCFVGCCVGVYCCRQRVLAWCNSSRTRYSDLGLVDNGRGQQPNNNVNQPANSTPGGSRRQANDSDQATPTDNQEMEPLVDQSRPHQPEDSGTSSTQRPTTHMPQGSVGNGRNVATVPAENDELPEDICCYCGEWAGEMLCKVPSIQTKMCDLSKHFRNEGDVCNKLFNALRGTEYVNNRIANTEDLYQKLYAEIDNLTVAKFLKAFESIDYSGVLEKVHDTFHPIQNLV